MSITREQVADLQPGDVVEVRDEDWSGTVISGPLVRRSWGLTLGDYVTVRNGDDGLPDKAHSRILTVVSRAPRPLYVNHPRTEPVPGDVAADWESSDDGCRILLRTAGQRFPAKWVDQNGMERIYRQPARLRLLVDGETGQVVP